MFDLLKNFIEIKFGKKIEHQIDCKNLSISIQTTTGKAVSTSTLRRLFGFLPTNSQPNRNTLDALAEYCGFENWENFQLKGVVTRSKSTWLELWNGAQKLAKDLSKATCKSFCEKNSIIPIIHRQFAEDRISAFLSQSQMNATAFIAPGGFGKSALLVKWYEKANKSRLHNKDIILFIPAMALDPCIKFEIKIEAWLSSILGFSPDFFSSLAKSSTWKMAAGRIVIIIDGIDELLVLGNKSTELGIELKKFIEGLTAVNNIKFILSSRLADWHEIMGNTPDWYMLNTSNFSEIGANIPPFNEREIQGILDLTINTSAPKKILVEFFSTDFQKVISYPYYLQILIETYEPRNSLLLHDRLDLLNEFLKKQIFKSEYSDEKTDLLNKIVELAEFGINGASIRKNDLREHYPIHLKLAGNYFNAYSQLLSFGIIKEDLIENRYGSHVKMVSIASQPIFELLVVQKRIELHGGITFQLFQDIEKAYQGSKFLPSIITLLFELAYKERNTDAISRFFNLNIETLESALKQTTIQNCLRYDEFMRRELLPLYACNPNARHLLFEQNIDLNYITTNYLYSIDCYHFSNNNEKSVLFSKTLQCFSGFLTLEFAKVLDNRNLFIPNEPLNSLPLVAGIWYSNKLLGAYFNLFGSTSKIIDEIDYYHTNQIVTNGLVAIEQFEIGLSYGLVLTKNFQTLSKRLQQFKLIPTEISSPIQKLLFILKAYANWKRNQPINQTDIIHIENFLNDLPHWCSFQPIILAKALVATNYLQTTNSQKAYEAFKTATEISNFANYKIYEVKLLKNLSLVLQKLGEERKAIECEEFARSMIDSTQINYEIL